VDVRFAPSEESEVPCQMCINMLIIF
jgi:hypothetical protein